MAIDTGFGKVKLFDDFLGLAMDETHVWNAGTENSGTQAVSVQVDGAMILTTGTTSGNRVLTTGEMNWQASDGGPLIGEFRVKNVTAITTRAIFVGFVDVIATTVEMPIEMSGVALTSTATDAVGFLYDTDSDNDTWYGVGVKADADATAVDSTIAPVADTYQTLRVVVNISGDAEFFINGKYVGSVANAVTATTDLTPVMCIENRSTTAARVLNIDYVYCEKGRASA